MSITRTYLNRETGSTVTISESSTGMSSIQKSIGGLVLETAMVVEKDAAPIVTTYEYDSLGRNIATVDPRTGRSTTEYEPETGRPIAQVDPEGRRTVIEYYPIGHKNAGQVKATLNPDGKSQQVAYNNQGRQIAVWGDTTYPIAYDYNEYGEMVGMRTYRETPDGLPMFEENKGAATHWAYDEATGVLRNKTYADGKGIDYEYSPAGQLLTRTWARPGTADVPAGIHNPDPNPDPAPASTIKQGPIADQTGSDRKEVGAVVPNRPPNTPAKAAARLTTTYTYDEKNSALTQVIYPGSPETGSITYQHDAFGRVLSVTDLTGTRAFEYNRYGQLIAENVTLKLSDDANAKPLKYKIERTYTSQNQPDGVFLKTDQTSPVQIDHQVTYQWNKLGQLAAVESPVAGKFSYEYDKENPALLKSITAPAHTVHYAYEPHRDLVTSVINETRVGTIVPNRPQSPSAEAHPQNNPVHPVQKDPGKVILSRYDYHNDTLGRRTKIAQTGLAFQQLSTGENRIDVAYNDRSEVIGTKTLTSADPQSLSDFDVQSSTFDVQRSEGFAFDAIGNRLNQKTVSSNQSSEISYETNTLNQYKKIVSSDQISADQRPSAVNPANTPAAATEARDHDLDGNLLEDDRHHYTWNAENRLIAVESKDGKSRTEHSYDYQGRRTVKRIFTRSNATKNFTLKTENFSIYDGWILLAEVTTSSPPSPALNPESRPLNPSQPHSMRIYTWGRDLSGSLQGAGGVGGLLAISENSNSQLPASSSTKEKNLFPLFDANGNIGQMIAEDSSIKAGYQYSAFGSVTATFGEEAESNPWRFSTKPVEADTGWSYYGFRYYSPLVGRWISKDPITEEGGVNLYGFVGNDGVGLADRLGLDFIAFGGTRVGIPKSIPIVGGKKLPQGHLIVQKWKSKCELKPEHLHKWSTETDLRKLLLGDLTWAAGTELFPGTFKWKIELSSTQNNHPIGLLLESSSQSGTTWQRGMIMSIKNYDQKAKGKEIMPIFTGTEEEVARKWEEIMQNARDYEFAEEPGYTRPQRFPDSLYGDPAIKTLLMGGGSGPLKIPFNNSNTYAKTIVSDAGISLQGVGWRYSGNYPAEKISMSYHFGGPGGSVGIYYSFVGRPEPDR